jgi:hypothetical protein
MKRIFRFRAVRTKPFNLGDYLEKQFTKFRKNYCIILFDTCSVRNKPYISIIKEYKNGKLM